RGGVVFQVCSEQKIPVKYVGIGEGIDDLQTFETKQFVDALFL
ncbi:MAG: signal recognition particle-docking protein FtsY, partial [Melioribacteraceae bacterium]|nr:signal recognition particle-docking protein FtsY [Melioribacteraceae bacterium]